MLPELFKIGSFPIRSYGVLLVIGVIVAVHLARKRATSFGIDKEKIWDSSMWMVLPGILGARIVYIVQFWDHYKLHPEELYSIRFEGLTSFGGLIFGFLGFLVWQRFSKVPFWSFLDTVGVPVLVAQAIGRIGCLLNGCCYGRPTTAWYGVEFHGLKEPHVPAQIVDTLLMLAGALVITVIEKKRNLLSGSSFGMFLIAYGISRFVYEIFRAGTKAEMDQGIASSVYLRGLPITSAQLTTMGICVLGLICLLIAKRRASAVIPEKLPVEQTS